MTKHGELFGIKLPDMANCVGSGRVSDTSLPAKPLDTTSAAVYGRRDNNVVEDPNYRVWNQCQWVLLREYAVIQAQLSIE
jgi:hypothetical protein